MPRRIKTWDHPDLGRFRYDYPGWSAPQAFPAFEPFIYREFGRLVGQSSLTLMFLFRDDEPDDDDPDPPSRGAIAVAQRVLKNQHDLAERLLRAVWRHLKGVGPTSMHWWHGDLENVRDDIAASFRNRKKPLEPPPLKNREDLYRVLGARCVVIRDSFADYEKPSATINFESAFDSEHGVGILTDGRKILGIGNDSQVSPFAKTK